jgi:hypothetical protein
MAEMRMPILRGVRKMSGTRRGTGKGIKGMVPLVVPFVPFVTEEVLPLAVRLLVLDTLVTEVMLLR